MKKIIAHRPYKERENAKERKDRAKAAISAILGVKGLPEPQRKTILRGLLYLWSEAEPTYRHETRYQSEDACMMVDHKPHTLVHEHVLTRKSVVKDLMENPKEIDRILDSAVVCTITREEDKKLKDVKKLNGWQRYREAGITVYDTKYTPPRLKNEFEVMTKIESLLDQVKDLPDARIEEVIKFVEWLKVRENGAFESWLMTLGWSDWRSKAEDEAWAYLDEEPETQEKENNT